jgi:hypothetical protein
VTVVGTEWFVFSWILNALLITVFVALLDTVEHYGIENKPWVGAFFVFLMPSLAEAGSFLFLGQRPFWYYVLFCMQHHGVC